MYKSLLHAGKFTRARSLYDLTTTPQSFTLKNYSARVIHLYFFKYIFTAYFFFSPLTLGRTQNAVLSLVAHRHQQLGVMPPESNLSFVNSLFFLNQLQCCTDKNNVQT